MTKVATIDMRRFLHIMVIAAMVIATLLAAMMPTIVSAADNPADNEDSTSGQFSTNDSSSPPKVNSVALVLSDNSTPASSMDPLTEYYIHVSVTDNQQLLHLDDVTVTIWYDVQADHTPVPTAVDNQTCAIITWTPDDTWTLTNMGASSTWAKTNGETPILTNNSGTFVFKFTPGKVATEASGTPEWDIYVEATDAADGYDDESLNNLNMNWYAEVSSVPAGPINFGSVDLDDEHEQGPFTVTYKCNGNYSEQVRTSGQWSTGTYTVDLENSGSPGNGHFTLELDLEHNTSQDVQVTNADQTIDATQGITSEDGNSESTIYMWVTLGPSGIVSGTYTGTIYFKIVDRA